jgi:hypothetical protein
MPYSDYRQATPLDYAYIVRLLIDGDEMGVLVRSLLRSDQPPYPLLDISRGPFRVTADGIEGYSLEGQLCCLKIMDNAMGNVALRRGDSDWLELEMGSVILLIR